MKKRLSAVLALLASACLAPPTRAADEQASFVVAVDGNDANPGTLSQPFATLERARDEVRKANAAKAADKPIVVAVRGGDYFRTHALELTAGDSGTAAAPVIWRAYNEERVRLLGGRTLTGFQPVADPAVVARLDEVARKHVVQLNLRALGIAIYGEMISRGFSRSVSVAHSELFFSSP